MSIVVGEITYTNILPLFFYLDRESLKRLGFKFLPQTPSILNEEMSAGNIQIVAISSFSYGEHFNNYSIFPDLSVSSTKAVRSIYLFSKVPLKKLNEKNVALTASSATSVNLLKIILQLFYNLDAIYTVMIPNISTMMEQQDACLLIGDDAIVAYRQYSRKYYCYDLGALWYRHTGFPMTYAVLAIRNEILNTKQSVVQILYDQLMMSKKKSIDNGFKDLISPIKSLLGGKNSDWKNYFQGLSYDFDEKYQEGLAYYFRLANQIGVLNKVNKFVFFDQSHHYHSLK